MAKRDISILLGIQYSLFGPKPVTLLAEEPQCTLNVIIIPILSGAVSVY
jgi:hypothetical protein